MKKLCLITVSIFLMMSCSDDSVKSPQKVGWAIGHRPDWTAAILFTDNGGQSWEEQGDPTLWKGINGNDISAVDEWTAWAAVGNEGKGAILHTADGGFTWKIQSFPEGVEDEVKGIKGLSRDVAWAVTLSGTVMRTDDGGEPWAVIPHENVPIKQVNRIDAKGQDIWIADYGNTTAMIHSPDFGKTWLLEPLPEDPDIPETRPMGVTIVDSQTAWAAIKSYPELYRTMDSGAIWDAYSLTLSGLGDIDDICAPSADTVWAVQNQSATSGAIIRAQVVNGELKSENIDPTGRYAYEGVTCFDEKMVWIVGMKPHAFEQDLPDGVILHTTDGTHWKSQPLPVKDVALWKVSFVGAHR